MLYLFFVLAMNVSRAEDVAECLDCVAAVMDPSQKKMVWDTKQAIHREFNVTELRSGVSIEKINEVIQGIYQESPGLKDSLPEEALQQSLKYFSEHRDRFPNQEYMSVINYDQPSGEYRFYLLNFETLKVSRHLVAHGRKSGDVIPTDFSNEPGSLQSSLGAFRVSEWHQGPRYGNSLSLDGLEPGVNSNARRRALLVHRAQFVEEEFAKGFKRLEGTSEGCPALSYRDFEYVTARIENGSFMYVYSKSRK